MATWKPSKQQAREFAQKMQDPEFAKEYYERKAKRAEKRRANSNYDYSSAGGYYVPTEIQYLTAMQLLQSNELDNNIKEACNQVIYGYTNKEKIHHDYIHIINQFARKNY